MNNESHNKSYLEIKIIFVVAIIAIMVGCHGGCKGNRDEDYIRGVREIKKASKQYWDSVNKLSKEPAK